MKTIVKTTVIALVTICSCSLPNAYGQINVVGEIPFTEVDITAGQNEGRDIEEPKVLVASIPVGAFIGAQNHSLREDRKRAFNEFRNIDWAFSVLLSIRVYPDGNVRKSLEGRPGWFVRDVGYKYNLVRTKKGELIVTYLERDRSGHEKSVNLKLKYEIKGKSLLFSIESTEETIETEEIKAEEEC